MMNLKILMNVLNKYAPIKEKTVRGNNAPFMNRSLSLAFMERRRLKTNIMNLIFETGEEKILQQSRHKSV